MLMFIQMHLFLSLQLSVKAFTIFSIFASNYTKLEDIWFW